MKIFLLQYDYTRTAIVFYYNSDLQTKLYSNIIFHVWIRILSLLFSLMILFDSFPGGKKRCVRQINQLLILARATLHIHRDTWVVINGYSDYAIAKKLMNFLNISITSQNINGFVRVTNNNNLFKVQIFKHVQWTLQIHYRTSKKIHK